MCHMSCRHGFISGVVFTVKVISAVGQSMFLCLCMWQRSSLTHTPTSALLTASIEQNWIVHPFKHSFVRSFVHPLFTWPLVRISPLEWVTCKWTAHIYESIWILVWQNIFIEREKYGYCFIALYVRNKCTSIFNKAFLDIRWGLCFNVRWPVTVGVGTNIALHKNVQYSYKSEEFKKI